jgi:hypothetical protein
MSFLFIARRIAASESDIPRFIPYRRGMEFLLHFSELKRRSHFTSESLWPGTESH